MEVRRSSGGDIAHIERRTLTTICVGGVVQRWCNWHTANGTSTARAGGGGKDAIYQARRPMRLERCKVGIEIHPFGLPLLLVNVRHPHQWRAPSL
jgi:hypothetical protein